MKQNLTSPLKRPLLLLGLPTLMLGLLAPTLANAETESDRERRMRSEKTDRTITSSQMYKWLPELGRQRVAPMKPTWCHLTTRWKGKVAGSYMRRTLRQVKRYGLGTKLVVNVADALCAWPNQPTWRAQTGYFVQRYVNETGLSKKDALAGIVARMSGAKWKRDKTTYCKSLTISAEASDEQKLIRKARRSLYGCRSSSGFWRTLGTSSTELFWRLDKGTAIDSEELKSYLVLDCLKRSEKAAKDPHILARYGVCGIDARSLSRAKLEKELSRAPHNLYSRTLARETFGNAVAAAGRYRRVIDAYAKRDPEYKKLFYDAPKAGWNRWVASYKANKAAFDAAGAFDIKLHGPSRNAMRGCRARLRSKLQAYVKARRIRSKKQLYKVLSDVVSGTLLGGLVSCSGVEGNQWEGYVFAKLLRKVRNAGGPRAASLYAIVDALGEIRKDRTRFPLTVRNFGAAAEPDRESTQRKLWASRKLRGSFIVEKGKGTVRRMKKTKHGLHLTFKRTRVKEDVHECKRGRIWKIDSGGKVLYHRNCTRIGSKWVNTTAKPITIPLDAAGGIRRGSFVKFVADYPYNNAKLLRRGYPVIVYKSKRLKRLVAGFGFKL